MNTTFDATSIKNKLKANIALLLWIILFALLVAEGFVVKKSIDLFQGAEVIDTPIAASSAVRVNMVLYNGILQRIEKNRGYVPASGDVADPFGLQGSWNSF